MTSFECSCLALISACLYIALPFNSWIIECQWSDRTKSKGVIPLTECNEGVRERMSQLLCHHCSSRAAKWQTEEDSSLCEGGSLNWKKAGVRCELSTFWKVQRRVLKAVNKIHHIVSLLRAGKHGIPHCQGKSHYTWPESWHHPLKTQKSVVMETVQMVTVQTDFSSPSCVSRETEEGKPVASQCSLTFPKTHM